MRAASRGTAAQTSLYAVSLVVSSLSSAAAGIVLARSMSTAEFGVYSFCVTTLMVLGLVFEFGLFFPLARIAAHQSPAERRATVGTALALFVPTGIVLGLSTAALSSVADRLFAVHGGAVLLMAAPLAFAVPFKAVAQWLAQGMDRLNSFSIASLGAGGMFVLALAAWRRWLQLDAETALALQLATAAVAWIALVITFQPRFDTVRARCLEVARHARQYGVQVYIGRLFSTGTYQMDVMMLASLGDATTVGYYVLASAIGNAAPMPVLAFGTAAFSRLAKSSSIPGRYISLSWLVALGCAGLATVWAGPIIAAVYTYRYSPAAALVFPLALAGAARVLANLYNTFLAAHGSGRELRDAGMALTVTNIVLNLTLIPPYGAAGAAWASLGAMVVNYLFHVSGYRATVRRLRSVSTLVPRGEAVQ